MNLLKNKIIPVFYFQFLVIIGCHNNAHLRTQKLLKPGEKSISISGVIPVGGIIDLVRNFLGGGLAGLIALLVFVSIMDK